MSGSRKPRKKVSYTVMALENNAQLSHDGNLGAGHTHTMELTESGAAALVRKRFPAL